MEYALLLVDGQGNFDLLMEIAQQQCVILKLECKISEEIMADIEKETVDFQLNFDDTLYEQKCQLEFQLTY
jgi:DNA gyrase subunit A